MVFDNKIKSVDKIISNLSEVVMAYVYGIKYKYHPSNSNSGVLDEILSDMDSLTPDQILEFSKVDSSPLMNSYLSKLIQKSYNAGHNDFRVDSGSDILSIGGLNGTPENILKLTLSDNVSTFFGDNCSYSNFLILGNAGYGLGNESNNCLYRVAGQIKGGCFIHANDCMLVCDDIILPTNAAGYVFAENSKGIEVITGNVDLCEELKKCEYFNIRLNTENMKPVEGVADDSLEEFSNMIKKIYS